MCIPVLFIRGSPQGGEGDLKEPRHGCKLSYFLLFISLYLVPIQFTVFPQSAQVNETNPIFLSCDASGFPEPSFVWMKDGRVVSKSKQATKHSKK